MSEQVPTSHDADQLLAAKNEILSLWRALPPEHQATMALVLVAEVVDAGEYDDWLRQAIAYCRPEELDAQRGEDSPF